MKNVIDHVDSLIEIAENIEPYKITILTGSNGAGKSLIRKIVGPRISEKLERDQNQNIVAQTSMQQRTESRPDFGALSGIMRDTDWSPTSLETIRKIKGLVKNCSDRYIVIDEPEIGMGEETVMGLIQYLNKTLKSLMKDNKCLGVMVITHSRLIVQHLKVDNFVNIDGLTKDKWLNRIVEPVDLEDLEERSNLVFREVQNRINANKEKKD